MKIKHLILILLICFPIIIAFKSDEMTIGQLVQNQNQLYKQKNIEAKIKIVNRRPVKVDSKEIYLLFEYGKKSNNVQLYIGKKWQKVITTSIKANLLTSQAELLKSTNKKQVTRGIKQLLRAIFTLIDQNQRITSQVDLSQNDLEKILKPRSLTLPVAIMFGLIFMGGAYLYQKFIFKR